MYCERATEEIFINWQENKTIERTCTRTAKMKLIWYERDSNSPIFTERFWQFSWNFIIFQLINNVEWRWGFGKEKTKKQYFAVDFLEINFSVQVRIWRNFTITVGYYIFRTLLLILNLSAGWRHYGLGFYGLR